MLVATLGVQAARALANVHYDVAVCMSSDVYIGASMHVWGLCGSKWLYSYFRVHSAVWIQRPFISAEIS